MRPLICVCLFFAVLCAAAFAQEKDPLRPAIIIEGSAMTPLKDTADWLGATIVRDIPRGDFVLWRGSKEFFRMPCLVWHEKAYISLRALAVQLQGKYVILSAYLDALASVVGAPEPSSIVLLITGLIGVLAYAWRKRK